MNLIEIILLAIALGIDCLVVSFCQGLILLSDNRIKNALALALTMGIFQGGMPIITYYAAGFVSEYLQEYSNYIVFCIFCLLGIKFIFEAFQTKESCSAINVKAKHLILMGIATSIDALGAGITLKFTHSPIATSAIIIAITSIIMSIIGFNVGNLFKNLPQRFLELSGGMILIFLGLKSLI